MKFARLKFRGTQSICKVHKISMQIQYKIYGNINCSEFDVGELRYSYGLGVTWITQLGPMSLALAATGNAGPLDRTEGFQFEIGTQF